MPSWGNLWVTDSGSASTTAELEESMDKDAVTRGGANLLTFRLVVPEVNYGKFIYGAQDRRREKLYEDVERTSREVSRVESVGLTAGLPLAKSFNPWPVAVSGRAPEPKAMKMVDSDNDSTDIQTVNPVLSYFGSQAVERAFL